VPFAADLAEPAQRGRTVGTVMSGLLCGILLARTLSGFVGAAFGWREMFWLGAGLAVLMTLLLAVMLPHSAPKTSMSYPRLMRSLGQLWAEHPTLRRASLIQACLFGGFSVFWSTLALLLQGPPYHMGSAVAGLFGIVGLVGVGAASLAGRLADRRGPRGGVGLGILLVIAAFAAFGLIRSMTGLVIGVILLDLGVQMAMVSNQTLIFSLGEATRARLNTIYVTALFLGGAAGSGGASVAWEHGGWPAVSALGAALGVVAIGIHLWDRAAATSATTLDQSPGRG
jgi:predicted MFS family arabinose efflux permease